MSSDRTMRPHRARRLAARGGVAALGALGLGVGLAGVAGASTTQNITANLSYSCTVTTPAITLSDQAVSVTLTATAPASVAPGQSFQVSATSETTLPSLIASTAADLGITGVTVTKVQAAVTATNVTPTSTTDDAASGALPMNVPESDFTSPIDVPLAPLTFTAGSTPGTATFTAGNLSVDTTIQGGSLAGDTASLACTPASGANMTIGSVAIAAVSTTPVGAIGGAVLAGVLGVGAFGGYAVRRRRPVVESTSVH
jgi:hypothetical protein